MVDLVVIDRQRGKEKGWEGGWVKGGVELVELVVIMGRVGNVVYYPQQESPPT